MKVLLSSSATKDEFSGFFSTIGYMTNLMSLRIGTISYIQHGRYQHLTSIKEEADKRALVLLRREIPLKVVCIKVRKRAKIENQYKQAPHLSQDKNAKLKTTQLDITNESQEVSPFPAGGHNASINRWA